MPTSSPNTKKYIISGGPGAGKTTLLHALKDSGYFIYDEVSRQLINELVQSNSQFLPWINMGEFAKLALSRMIEAYQSANLYNSIAFFDRGIPDIIAYLKFSNIKIDDIFYSAIDQYKYNPTVFMAPPWEEIYINDDARNETFAESKIIYAALSDIYKECGFNVIELPLISVQERVAFVKSSI
jgi:predicted ATPase